MKSKKIGLNIHKISSFGCNKNWHEISTTSEENNETIYRNLNVSKLYVIIYKDMNKKEYGLSESNNFSNYFIQPIDIIFFIVFPKFIVN